MDARGVTRFTTVLLFALALACETLGQINDVTVSATHVPRESGGPASAAQSLLHVSTEDAEVSVPMTLIIRVYDARGTAITTGGLTVAFIAVGHATGAFDPPTDHQDGTYSTRFTPTSAGDLTLGAAVAGAHLPRTYSMLVRESKIDRRGR